MAQIPNQNAQTVSDGLNNYWNIDTLNKVISVLNNIPIKMYSDGGATVALQLLNGSLALLGSGAAQVIANGATINTANIGRARVAPAASVTGIILQPGTVDGQLCMVTNTSAAGNNVTFAAAGTSNVADGATAAINGVQSRMFVWDATTSLWYRMN